MISFFLIAPGVLAGYLAARPFLHRIAVLKPFYDEADTRFGKKVWAVCGKSVTVLWGYFLAFLSAVWSLPDPLSQLFGVPQFKQQIVDALKDHPHGSAIS